MEKVGIYPGTFDPITFGHLDIVEKSLKVVDKLIVAVAVDTGKEPIFDIEKRCELVKKELPGSNVEAKAFSGLLTNFCKKEGSNLVIRGLRVVSDFEYEFQMSCMNSRLFPELQTIFIPASDSKQFISSRFVKEIARLGGDLSAFVPSSVARELKLFYEK
jgi:pantetheine-phosphate adenylyltransferase